MGIFEANPKAALDDQLMAQVAQGDHHALQTLYDLTRRGIYGFALSITGHYADAEDVTQETYLRAYQAAVAGQYQAMGKPMAWLMTIARNLARMKLREGSRSAGLDEEALTRLPAPASLDAEDKMVLGAAMAALTPEERQVVMLHASLGLKHREIAHLLDMPLSTVLSKYHRALSKLRKKLQEAEA